MALRNWDDVPYLPILALSPAEMQALQQLPNKNKDAILPYIHLRPWMSAASLEKALAKIEKSYPGRPYVVDMSDPEPGDEEQSRPVFEELRKLRASTNGYSAWCEFIEERPHLIPALQLGQPAAIPAQCERLHGFGRGLAVHLQPEMLAASAAIAALVGANTEGGADVCFVVDYGRQDRNLLLNQAQSVGMVAAIRSAAPYARIAISASSFPSSFTHISDQEIFERRHFNGVRSHVGSEGIIYSDRGSARAEKQTGGGGTPAPRIDYAAAQAWNFFRSEPVEREERPAAYVEQALLAMDHDCWDDDLHVWGKQMIERTANDDEYKIHSPHTSTAARINIHLHHQLFHDDEGGLYDTDEDWTD